MSETWIRPDTTSANLSEITPPGYNVYQQFPRSNKRGNMGYIIFISLTYYLILTRHKYKHLKKKKKKFNNVCYILTGQRGPRWPSG